MTSFKFSQETSEVGTIVSTFCHKETTAQRGAQGHTSNKQSRWYLNPVWLESHVLKLDYYILSGHLL